MRSVSREQVLGFRVRAQQLDRASGSLADTAVLDIGVQDSGPDGALWALTIRGAGSLPADRLATVWTIRGAPHVYRRADLPAVVAATAPFSEDDAAKRIFDAARPLKAAGIPVLAALDTLAGAMRSIVLEPMVKAEMSTRLTAVVDEPYKRFCVPCDAVHVWEQPFRLSALPAGLELQPGTSPPVLRPIPGFAPADEVPERLDVVRAYLRLLGPATPKHIADFLDAPVTEVQARWPEDAVEVDVAGERRWLLAGDLDGLGEIRTATRLLGPFDLHLQARDRTFLVPDRGRARELWRPLGRPGALLVDGEIVGTWRGRRAGAAVAVAVETWTPVGQEVRASIGEQADRLAAFRQLSLRSLEINA